MAATDWLMVALVCLATSTVTAEMASTTTTSATNYDGTPPMITINPSSTVFAGTSVPLQCSATGSPTPTYTWTKNKVALNNTGNIQHQSAGNILINPASSSDNGYYQCVATNQRGTAVSTVAYIQAASLGTFPSLSTAYSMSKQPGTSLTIPCNGAPASVPAVQYSWSIQSITSSASITQVYPSSRIQINSAGALVFANVVSSDATLSATVYRCSAYNSVMGTTVSGSNTTLTVSGSEVYSAPNWLFLSNSMSVVLGQTFTIDCFFAGNPTPAITWSVPGGSLPSGRYTIDSSGTQLTISDAQLTDAVAYQCTGANSKGSQSLTIKVYVNIAPTFTDSTDGPASVDAANGDTVEFNCSFTAQPTGQISWYRNGQPLQANSLPAKYSLSADQTVLTVSNVCSPCSDGSSDMAVIQCNVSNAFGFAYGQADLTIVPAAQVTTAGTFPPTTTTGVTAQPGNASACPAGFTYMANVNGCYKVVSSSLPWPLAARRCRQMHQKAHLVFINSAREHRTVTRLLYSANAQRCARRIDLGVGWWTGGHQGDGVIHARDFVWRSAPTAAAVDVAMKYTNWYPGQPDSVSPACLCVYLGRPNGAWDDCACFDPLCALCEIDL